jgi:hypothetical protein
MQPRTRKPSLTALSAFAAAAFALPLAGALAAPSERDTPRFVTGGVSIEEAGALQRQRGDFTLWLVTAAQSGAYLSGAEAQIVDRNGDTVLQTQLRGPYLMADLAPGVYTVRVNYGDQVREARVGIQPGTTREYLMRFESPAQLSPDLRRG